MNGPGQPPTPAEALFPAIKRLDALVGAALRRAEEIYGQQSATDPYRGLYISEEEAQQLLRREPGAPLFAAEMKEGDPGDRLNQLRSDFGLDGFDLDLLVVALAPELDLRYERLYAYLQDDVTKKRPSVDLALNLLCRSAADKIERRKHLAPESPLIRQGLLRVIVDPGQVSPPLLSCYLKVDEQVVKFVLGMTGLDSRIASFCELISPRVELADLVLPEELKAALAAMTRQAAESKLPCKVYLQGPAGVGKRTLAEALAHACGRSLLSVNVALLSPAALDFGGAIDLAFRDGRFADAVLYVEGMESLGGEDRRPAAQGILNRIGAFAGIVLAGGETAWTDAGRAESGMITVELPRPSYATRRILWTRELTAHGLEVDDAELTALANRYLFTPRQIERTVAAAQKQRELRAAAGKESVGSLADDLIAAGREECKPALGRLAVRIVPKARWEDLVLPEDQKLQLLEICVRAEYRFRVYSEWGFEEKLSTGKGLNVLFSGPPGAGKTMGAEVIAARLRLDLEKIDLSQIVSKYIGETEKNVSRVFEEAKVSNCILFFDEADALFGRRSEVRDAHDRYANVEVAYLLQQMDEYEGISILATNLKQNIDDAFLRRLTFSVEFPFPDESSRRRIWESAWPTAVPRDPEIDFGHLARQFRFSGGNIKNATLGAAFLGAPKQSVGMVDLLMAARREMEKQGKAPSRQDYGAWWDAVQGRIKAEWERTKAS